MSPFQMRAVARSVFEDRDGSLFFVPADSCSFGWRLSHCRSASWHFGLEQSIEYQHPGGIMNRSLFVSPCSCSWGTNISVSVIARPNMANTLRIGEIAARL